MYTGLSMILFLEKNWKNEKRKEKIWYTNNIIPILIAVILGGCIEILQPILSDRGRDFWDFVANTTGVVLGFHLHRGILPVLKGQKIFRIVLVVFNNTSKSFFHKKSKKIFANSRKVVVNRTFFF